MKKVSEPIETYARLRVIGVGGSGGNAINHMIKSRLEGVEFITANTDAQDLKKSKAEKKIHLGRKITRGLGAGMDVDLGREAAEESRNEIAESIKGTDLLFIACGMGGGTGTGASPVVAKIARELGILTVAIVTKPFVFEGKKRRQIAEEGINELSHYVDAIVTIENDNIIKVSDKTTTAKRAFEMSDNVLLHSLRGISDLITNAGSINIDFADIRTVMENSGSTLMGLGIAKGEGRGEAAVRQALHSPILDMSIKGAKRILFSIASKGDLGMTEMQGIAERITESVDPEAKIIFGTTVDNNLKNGELMITLIATSFDDEKVGGRDMPSTTPQANFAQRGTMPDYGSDEDIIRIGDDDLDDDK